MKTRACSCGDLPANASPTCVKPEHVRGTSAGLWIGTRRIVFDGTGRLHIEPAPSCAGDELRPPVPAFFSAPHVDVRPNAVEAVWSVIAAGVRVIRVAGSAGAGTTTLLGLLAAAAGDHGFPDGAFICSAAGGTVGDVEQQITRLFDSAVPARFYDAGDRAALCDGRRALVLLDDARLTAPTVNRLAESFPSLTFVVAATFDHPAAATIVLGALDAAAVRTLLVESSGRPIDDDNERVARALCATVGSLPGPTRLIGIAARYFERSFISLHVQFASGDAVIRELVASLPDGERRILGILALAGAPLAAHHIAYILRGGQIHTSLERLISCELIRVCGTEMYDVPTYVARLVSPESDADALAARIVHALCDTLDSWPAAEIDECQLAGAQHVLADAAGHAQWHDVFDLGFRLARNVALRGRFGAWSDLLDRIEAAAGRAADAAVIERVHHDRAILASIPGQPTRAFDSMTVPDDRPAEIAPVTASLAAFSFRRAFATLAAGVGIVALFGVAVIAPAFLEGDRRDSRIAIRATPARTEPPRAAMPARTSRIVKSHVIRRLDVTVVTVVTPRRPVRRHLVATADERLTGRAVYQFDVTPGRVRRGQLVSLCVGVGRPARGFVTHIGALEPGITRCYRIAPPATTTYRLYVALGSATLERALTVAVRGSARREVASAGRH